MRTFSFVALVIGALVVHAGTALAHSTLVSSDPADGAVLAAQPPHLVLNFNEPVSPLVIRLIDDQGRSTALSYRVEDTAVIIDEPGDIGRGSHALSWRVVSADGHPVGGTILFSIGAPSATALPGADTTIDWPVRIAIWLCRLILYLAFFAGVGGLFFGTVIARNGLPRPRFQGALLVLGLIAIPVSVGLQGLDALNLPLSGLGQFAAWRAAAGTTWILTALIGFFTFAVALLGNRLRGRAASILAVAALLGVGASLAASGHASAAPPQWLTRPAVFLHVTAVTFWIGALIPLALALRRGDGAVALARFAAAVPLAVALLVLAGITLATIQVAKPEALWTTSYGRVLLAKLACVAVLLVLAALNRWRHTAGATAGDTRAVRRLFAAILLEFGLAMAILGLVSTWRFTPPPRALQDAAAQPIFVHIHTAKAMAIVTLTPGRSGPVDVSITVMTGDLGPPDAKEVTLELSDPAAGIEPIKRTAVKTGDASWKVDDLTVPIPGHWDIDVAILVSEFELVRLRDAVDIPK
jgi:copper transport protein